MVDGNEQPAPAPGEATAEAGHRLRVAVLGPGGVGGLVAALLAREGDDVVCVAGDRTAERLAADGIHVRSVSLGDFTVPVRAVTVLDEPVDVCFVTPKTTQLAEALDRVPQAALGVGGLVVPFCNGIGHVDMLRERYLYEQVVPATIRIESARVAPGEIEHTSPFAIVEIAPGGADRDRVEGLARHLAQTGLQVSVRDDEAAMLWDKLSILGPIALVTTFAGAPVGEARRRYPDELEALVNEVVAVAAAEGARLDGERILSLIQRIPDSMKSSMLRDAEAGLRTEIDAIGGEVVRGGRRHGIPTPVTDRIVGAIEERERAKATGAGA